jgi:hypothetical protein
MIAVQNNLTDTVLLQGFDIKTQAPSPAQQLPAGAVHRGSIVNVAYYTSFTVDGIVFDTYPLPTGAYSANAQQASATALFAYGFNNDGPSAPNCVSPSVTTTMTASATPGATLTFTSECSVPSDAIFSIVITLTKVSKTGGGAGGGSSTPAPKKNNKTAIYIGVGVGLVLVVILIIAVYEHRRR